MSPSAKVIYLRSYGDRDRDRDDDNVVRSSWTPRWSCCGTNRTTSSATFQGMADESARVVTTLLPDDS